MSSVQFALTTANNFMMWLGKINQYIRLVSFIRNNKSCLSFMMGLLSGLHCILTLFLNHKKLYPGSRNPEEWHLPKIISLAPLDWCESRYNIFLTDGSVGYLMVNRSRVLQLVSFFLVSVVLIEPPHLLNLALEPRNRRRGTKYHGSWKSEKERQTNYARNVVTKTLRYTVESG